MLRLLKWLAATKEGNYLLSLSLCIFALFSVTQHSPNDPLP
jgi:hypothetical protein